VLLGVFLPGVAISCAGVFVHCAHRSESMSNVLPWKLYRSLMVAFTGLVVMITCASVAPVAVYGFNVFSVVIAAGYTIFVCTCALGTLWIFCFWRYIGNRYASSQSFHEQQSLLHVGSLRSKCTATGYRDAGYVQPMSSARDFPHAEVSVIQVPEYAF
jgi:hypothetical protein